CDSGSLATSARPSSSPFPTKRLRTRAENQSGDEPEPTCPVDGLGTFADADLVVYLLQAPFHRTFRHPEARTDIAVAHARTGHCQHSDLRLTQGPCQMGG